MAIKVKKIPNLVSNRTSTEPEQNVMTDYFRNGNTRPHQLTEQDQDSRGKLYSGEQQLEEDLRVEKNFSQIHPSGNLQMYRDLLPTKLETTPYKPNNVVP